MFKFNLTNFLLTLKFTQLHVKKQCTLPNQIAQINVQLFYKESLCRDGSKCFFY